MRLLKKARLLRYRGENGNLLQAAHVAPIFTVHLALGLY